MAKTLLAVDDSVTMRKVIEMTFAGEDLRVLTVGTAQEALATCRREHPAAVLADVALDGFSGYDLCRAIKDEFGRIPVVLLSSKQNPFDPARGQAAGADGHLDKPYDTAKAIELVKGVLTQGRSVAPAPIAAAPIAAAPTAPRAPMFSAPQPPPPAPPPPAPVIRAAPAVVHPTMQGMPATRASAGGPALGRTPTPALQRQVTAKMPSEPPAQQPPSQPRPPSSPALKAQHTVRMASDAPPAAAVAGAAALPPELAGKLGELGLSPAQVDAVLALSREVVERVVWEVVPVLAETLIKEEISRLTREG
ncbi:MAG: response regulator [Deltaproteobacteria bacterium]|nr:response regulator [Deltaproteobacteria bacterium]